MNLSPLTWKLLTLEEHRQDYYILLRQGDYRKKFTNQKTILDSIPGQGAFCTFGN
jgi:hypothetical protein